MKKHYQIVNGHIVFDVQDEEAVLDEITELLNKEYEHPYEESIRFFVTLEDEFTKTGNENTTEMYTALSINAPESGIIINYTTKAPVLVNIDGKFYHYWDFALSEHTVTEINAEEYSMEYDMVKNIEEDIIDTLTGPAE